MENTSSSNGNVNNNINNSTNNNNLKGFGLKVKQIIENKNPFRKKDQKTKVVSEKKEWGPNWNEYSKIEKIKFVIFSIIKAILAIACLYLFLLSLNFMSVGFIMVAPYAIQGGNVIGFLLANPFSALTVGIIATALLQNATATTSIAIILVGAGIIPSVKGSVPIIMGANLGTCVTNSFIALTVADKPDIFKRAFSAATLNDGFNLLTIILLLPIEILSGFMFLTAEAITNQMALDNPDALASANFIGVILNPVTNWFIVLNSTAVNLLSSGNPDIKDTALRCCDQRNRTKTTFNEQCNGSVLLLKNQFTTPMANSLITQCKFNNTGTISTSIINTFDYNSTHNMLNYTILNQVPVLETFCYSECNYACMPMLRSFGDGGTGLFWVIISIIVLLGSLFALVKAISLLICGPISKNLGVLMTKKFPKPFHWVSQVIMFFVSLLLTIIVQSSNIITATLVPLCGQGIISVQQVYVMTLGSNIGTTVTGILTALAQPPLSLKKALQLGFVYTLFNVYGVLLWLPIPQLRLPKMYARRLGETVFKYKTFLYFYVGSLYFVVPIFLFGISLIPYWIGLAIVGIPVIILALLFLLLKFLQWISTKNNITTRLPFLKKILPEKLKTMDFLPVSLRSLEPWDRRIKFISKKVSEKLQFIPCCRKKKEISRKPSLVNPRRASNVFRELYTIEGLVEAAELASIVEVDEELENENQSPEDEKIKTNSIITIGTDSNEKMETFQFTEVPKEEKPEAESNL